VNLTEQIISTQGLKPQVTYSLAAHIRTFIGSIVPVSYWNDVVPKHK
jgi:hypothetical protein